MIQDPVLNLEVASKYSDILWSTESLRRHTIPKSVSWRRWMWAVAGRWPPRKNTTQGGVLGSNFWRLHTVSFTCCSISWTSLDFSTKAAVPDKRTGRQYTWWALNVAVGLALWPFARPAGSRAPSDFLWAENLVWIWTRLPCTERTMPTCSASWTSSTGSPSIQRLLEGIKCWVNLLGEKTWSLVFPGLSVTCFFLQKYKLRLRRPWRELRSSATRATSSACPILEIVIGPISTPKSLDWASFNCSLL